MLSARMYKCATSQTLLSLELKSSGTIDENQKKYKVERERKIKSQWRQLWKLMNYENNNEQ